VTQRTGEATFGNGEGPVLPHDSAVSPIDGIDELAAPALAAAKTKHPLRARVITAVRVLAVLAILYFLVSTTVQQWSEVRRTFHVLSWPAVTLSLVAALVGIGANMMAWRAALTDLDHRVPVRTAAPIMLVGQLGKYLPGSLWAYVVQMELGRRAGVPRSKAFLASLVCTGVGVTVGLTIGTLGLPTAFEASRSSQHGTLGRLAFYAALCLLPVALVCVHPKVLNWLVSRLMRLMRRTTPHRPLTWHGVFAQAGWVAFAYTCFGVHLWLLAESQAAAGWSGLWRCIGTAALAFAVSVFVFIAPSGIGVREFLMAVALGGFGVTFGAAYGIALASRLIFVIADIIAAGGAAAVGAHRLKVADRSPG
jgi:uncharacterized membrane protein YbhN (UPF0104 family)